MEWKSVVFGAFLSVAGLYALTALALYAVMRRTFLVWLAIRTLCFTLVALSLLPLSLPEPLGGLEFSDLGEIAVALAAACTGPLLASYLERELDLGRMRLLLRSLFFAGIGAAAATAFAPRWPVLHVAHDLLLLVVVLGTCLGLVRAMRAGSRAARFQAGAWAPLIVLGFAILGYELALGGDAPFWAEAVLFALIADFLVSAVGIVDGFMIITRERDQAVADVAAARIAVATDPLTGIANRRGLALRFRSTAFGRPTGLAVVDCDHFKRINDQYGHDVGDEVLVAVARGLQRETVFAARQGGEEFILLLYGADWMDQVEDIRRALPVAVLEAVPEVVYPVTASAGLTAITPTDTLNTATKRADRALYAAKDAGRDRSLLLGEAQGSTPRLVASNG